MTFHLIYHIGFDSEVGDNPLIEICNGCVIMQAVNMTVVQVINVHLTPPPQPVTQSPPEPLTRPEVATGEMPDLAGLPTYFSNCNGCSIFSANSISTTQTVNLTMPEGFGGADQVEEFVKGSLAPDQDFDVNECNQCAVFNAVELHTIQIINCIEP